MFVRADTFLIVVLLKVVQIATNNIIDVDDILAEDYMPGTLLMLENPKGAIRNFNDSVGGDLTSREGDGTFDEAMETMGFHRWSDFLGVLDHQECFQVEDERVFVSELRRGGNNR
jgi:hypothetical protein